MKWRCSRRSYRSEGNALQNCSNIADASNKSFQRFVSSANVSGLARNWPWKMPEQQHSEHDGKDDEHQSGLSSCKSALMLSDTERGRNGLRVEVAWLVQSRELAQAAATSIARATTV